MKQPSYPCSCYKCKKEFSSFGIDTHFMRSHGTLEQLAVFKESALTNKKKAEKNKLDYYNTLNKCKECQSTILYEQRYNAFCSHSCSATASNRERLNAGYSLPEESRAEIRSKLSIFVGPYTKVYFKPCKFCSKTFTTADRSQVCKKCQHLKWNNNKDQYSFRFNIFDYPDLFDLNQLKSVGWVAFGGKRGGNKNTQGLSRDHRVSVNEAKKFNYDPYYISHPMNCELMPHTTNNKKKTKSSITYNELVKLVDEYDGVKDQTCTG
jgi:hypothetical protein